ncbi:hypothetical protein GCM10022243_26550 [Saccharothrix violaceirubra]|uniref:Immunity protein Imm1 n=1 Tax=Saccharothrix violaceirubra TaxID=413306 RepID=A0A7W7X020_9PSEU|nr:Imm1 family immunity protein [Saccharothrix violaceirubra]MBB4969423.1 hypothetical protein [Saccharothrix violaceirubra]
MSFTAHWHVYRPDELPAEETLVVETPADVDHLVARLSDPDSSPAMVFHSARPEIVSEWSGETVDDHLLWALVHKGFGYLDFHSPEHVSCALVGDPASEGYHYDYVDYDPGSGVALDLFTRALKEFLRTAERPTCAEWRDTD